MVYEKIGSMTSLTNPQKGHHADTIETESREKGLESLSTTDNASEVVDLEQNAAPLGGELGEGGNTVEKGSEFDVWWNEPVDQDLENPMNWTNKKKWSNIAIMSCITFLTPLASSMFAPGIPRVMTEFNSTSNVTATFVVSIFVLGFAFGPLILAPLGELYGRVIAIGCAVVQNMDMLLAFRFLAGFAGVATVTCGSGTVADMMPTEKRGGAMAMWALGPILGPIIGPVSGGFLIQAASWRCFWLITIAAGIVTVAAFLVLEETYAPVLLERSQTSGLITRITWRSE